MVLGVEPGVFGLAPPLQRLHHGTRHDDEVAIHVRVRRALSGKEKANGVASLGEVVLEPVTEPPLDALGLLREHRDRQLVAPVLRPVRLVERRPRVGLPRLREDDDAEGARDVVRAGEDVPNLLGEMPLVRPVREEPVVSRVGPEFPVRVLLFTEDEPVAARVDVERVLGDRRDLDREGVVVDRGVPSDVDLERLRLGARHVPHGE